MGKLPVINDIIFLLDIIELEFEVALIVGLLSAGN
jgi:hypothetical protein